MAAGSEYPTLTSKPPAFQWYPKECDTDENIRMMNDAEFGFFMRCLNHAWLNDGLPDNLDDISRALNRSLALVTKYWVRVGKCFHIENGRNRNSKQELQRKDALAFSEIKSKAANARWEQSRSNARAYADALRMECPASASASASAEEIIPPRGDDAFERIYAKHPRKGHRTAAEMNLAQSCAVGADLVEIERVHGLCVQFEWVNGQQKFAPFLDQWLIDKGWKYPPTAESPPPSNGKQSYEDRKKQEAMEIFERMHAK